jgi:sulfur-oxidizing protein SoxY
MTTAPDATKEIAMTECFDQPALSRRVVLVGVAALASGAGGARNAFAQAAPPAHIELLNKLVGGRKATPGKIKLQIPEIAENGNTVPLTVSVDSPMTAQSYVKAVHVACEKNPRPEVASFYFLPENGKAEVSTRIRLAETTHVAAYAELSDGSVWSTEAEAKVTIGGCGG